MKDKNGAEHSEQNGRFVSSNSGEKKEYGNLPSAKRLASNYNKHFGTSKMTPDEKIASVHIDFSKDNILPELNESELEKVGVKDNKPIRIKKSIIDRNDFYHGDAMIDADKIIGETLYSPAEVFHGKSDKDYFTFIKPLKLSVRNGKDEYGVVLLDVTDSNNSFDVIHWHWVNFDNLNSLRQKKKD